MNPPQQRVAVVYPLALAGRERAGPLLGLGSGLLLALLLLLAGTLGLLLPLPALAGELCLLPLMGGVGGIGEIQDLLVVVQMGLLEQMPLNHLGEVFGDVFGGAVGAICERCHGNCLGHANELAVLVKAAG